MKRIHTIVAGSLLLVTAVASAAPAGRKAKAAPAKPAATAQVLASLFSRLQMPVEPAQMKQQTERMAGSLVSADPRIPADDKRALILALSSKVDLVAIRKQIDGLWGESLTPKDVQQVMKFLDAPTGKLFLTLTGQTMKVATDLIRKSLVDNYQTVTHLAYMTEFPSPTAAPVPSAIPSLKPSPSPLPKPHRMNVEVSWLTKTIWKMFPETNTCVCGQ